jgi:hypothetical protein
MKIKDGFLSAILTTVLCFNGNLLAYPGGGDGTAENPYQISSVEDWQELMASPSDWSSSFILTADIDLAGVTLTPIGNSTTQFTGVFDGNDNVISNAEVNQPGSNYVGLFGYVEYGQIHDLGVEDINITGFFYVGGLVGRNDGMLTNCYATGSVSGVLSAIGGLVGENYGTVSGCHATGSVSDIIEAMDDIAGGLVGENYGIVTDCYWTGSIRGWNVGGLAGLNWYDGTVTNCFAIGSVSGWDVGGLVYLNVGTVTDCYAVGSFSGGSVGGLVDLNYGTVTNCYATGFVNGVYYAGGLIHLNNGTVTYCYATGSVSGDISVGGLVASNGGTVTASFWDIETSGQTTSDGGTGKSTVEMKTRSTFTSAGWDFVNETVNGTNDIWTIDEHVDYPKLAWSLDNFNGDGTPENPYQISSVEDWQLLMASPEDWSSCFILTADINLAGVALTPVGNSTTQFTGVFNGNDNVISNPKIDQPGDDDIGLFGRIGSGGQIHDLGVEDVNMTGYHRVGGLVGENHGTVTSCYATGTPNGYYDIGGLVGRNEGTLIECYATGSVSGTHNLGGLVGGNYGMVAGCYATGSVSGLQIVGGLVGWVHYGTVTDCYATGSVSGLQIVGGLVGWVHYGTITDCYATGSANGGVISGGLVGYNDRGTITRCYATGSVTAEVYGVGGLVCVCFDDDSTVTDCFWDVKTSGQTTSDGGTGKSTIEMKTLSTFTCAGWDMINVWDIGENQTYPFLRTHLPSDIDKDDETNLFDLAILAQNWLERI